MMLPAALLVLDAYPLRRVRFDGWRPRFAAGVLIEKIPFAVLALGAALLAWRGQQMNATFVGHASVLERVTQALYGLAFYPWKTLLPTGLSPFYELRDLDPGAAAFALPALATVVAAGALVRFKARAPALLAAFTAFAILLLPVLGLTQAGMQLVADRYTYLPGLALAPLIGFAWMRWGRTRAAVAIALVLLGIATYRYTDKWRTSESLWMHTVSVHPGNAQAHMNCSLVRQQQNRPAEMERHLRSYLEKVPEDADGWARLGNARALQGDHAQAVTLWRKALALNPDHAAAQKNLEQIAGDRR